MLIYPACSDAADARLSATVLPSHTVLVPVPSGRWQPRRLAQPTQNKAPAAQAAIT